MKQHVVFSQAKLQMVGCEAGEAADRPPALLLNINVAYQVLFYRSQSQSSRERPRALTIAPPPGSMKYARLLGFE